MKLIVFDMDGVLTEYFSSWVWVHEHFGTNNDESLEAYLKGEIDDLEFMRRDIALWMRKKEGLTREHLEEIFRDLPIRKGAKELMEWLRSQGVRTAIISGGIDLLARRIAKEIGIDYIFANGLEFDRDGRLTGEGKLRVVLRDKSIILRELKNDLGIKKEDCAAVGDSDIDATMFQECSLGIAFNPKESAKRLIESADYVVYGESLLEIRPYLERFLKGD